MTKALLHELGKSKSYGRLSLLAKVLWPMLLSTSDDQGRGDAEADPIKWYVCPNVPEIGIDDIPALLAEMAAQGMLHLYTCNGDSVYQVIHWWEYQQMRWARPSRWAPPEGWTDRIRYSNRGDIHDNEGWYTTGGFDAEPLETARSRSGKKPPDDSTEFCTETPQKTVETSNLTQPNLTQLNPTQPNLTSSGQALPVLHASQRAPPLSLSPPPPPPKRKTVQPDEIPKPDPAFGDLWRRKVLPVLTEYVDSTIHSMFMVPIDPLAVTDGVAWLGVSPLYDISRANRCYGRQIDDALRCAIDGVTGHTFIALAPGGT